MDRLVRTDARRLLTVFATLFFCCSATGCGLLANVMYAGWGGRVHARCKALEGKRVAVVCVSQSAEFGPTTAADQIAKHIGDLLRTNVKEIQLVEQQQIDDWMDRNDWNRIDYVEIGRGVSADMVVAVDLNSFSLHDGQTLYKGRANVEISVYDIVAGGNLVYSNTPSEIQYPENTGIHTTDISDAEFRRRYLMIVGSQIARHFYTYDELEDFARDTTVIR